MVKQNREIAAQKKCNIQYKYVDLQARAVLHLSTSV
jgi:hypothetical protein